MATVSEHRAAMESALKDVLVPVLRAQGFRGSWPEWRRTVNNRVDLVQIQHLSSGGTFFVNIGQLPEGGFATGPFREKPVATLRLTQARARTRVQPQPLTDGWTFAPRLYEAEAALGPPEAYANIARRCADRFLSWGLAWFDRPRSLETAIFGAEAE